MDFDGDVPDYGAAFVFGKRKIASDPVNSMKFWVRDDPILQVACGDEHTALLTASGRVLTFGSNEWGQLGHGHTNSLTKATWVRALKHERATVIACGRSHTLVSTDTGYVYGFGSNGEGQLGSPHEFTIHAAPVRIQGLEGITIKMLSAGADHSIALTDKGCVYVWGSGVEGQLGLEKAQCLVPTELKFDYGVMCISAGYYHSAFVTVDGKLYTCGESDCGKLGVSEVNTKKSTSLYQVLGIHGRVTYVSCGGNHTVALTADGKAYSFGDGSNGQLGLGNRILETCSAHLITCLERVKVARVSCGENHTGFLTDSGHLYTCGDSRHGKLPLLGSEASNQFFPVLLQRFSDFQVQQVACGGCHTLVLATKRKEGQSQSSEETNKAYLAKLYTARERRRKKKAKLSPLPCTSSSGVHVNKNSTLKTHPQLPSINKSPVWYIPLEKISDASGSTDEDEVLSKMEHRNSLLDDLEEDRSIRHVDSDVDSDNAEICDLNKTHTLVRVDNTISIVRPVITDDVNPSQDTEIKDNHEDELPVTEHSSNEIAKPAAKEFPSLVSDQAVASSQNKVGNALDTSVTRRNKEAQQSQFYDNEEDAPNSEIKSSSSTLSKSSKACIII